MVHSREGTIFTSFEIKLIPSAKTSSMSQSRKRRKRNGDGNAEEVFTAAKPKPTS